MKYLTILLFAFILTSCDFGSNAENNNANTDSDNTEKPKGTTPEIKDNWLIIPGKQVGKVQADFNKESFLKTFGENNVNEAEIGLGEGEIKKGLIVFPNTKNEMHILFEGEEEMEQVENIKIVGEEGSMWKTESGIQVGTSLEKLVELNGKDFKFFGFEWDYAGRLSTWDKGKLSEQIIVYLDPSNMESSTKLLGDAEFSSSDPNAKAAGLKVISYEIVFK